MPYVYMLVFFGALVYTQDMKVAIQNIERGTLQDLVKEVICVAFEEVFGDISGASMGSITRPQFFAHGDFASNIALGTAKTLGLPPMDIAQKIKTAIESVLHDGERLFSDVVVATPGFINMHIAPRVLETYIRACASGSGVVTFSRASRSGEASILVEHSSPNLFKPFHIGHMMNNAIGESIVRLKATSGSNLQTVTFPSDISIGIAKALFILIEKEGTDYQPDSVIALGQAYVAGVARFDTDPDCVSRVKEIADILYRGDVEAPEYALYIRCREYNLAYFDHVLARLGTETTEAPIFESEAGVVGKALVMQHIGSVFTESEGAIVYIPDEADAHLSTTVFINSQGNPTYAAKDLGLLKIKFDRYAHRGSDEDRFASFFVTDYQQAPHFAVVLHVAGMLQSDWRALSHHVPHGRMSFKGQKMSSRLGGVPLAVEVIDAVLEEVRERSAERSIATSTMDMIAIGAIKYAILRSKPGQNINFDPETSLSFEGDSGPYLQYTHARIATLLEKAEREGVSVGETFGRQCSSDLARSSTATSCARVCDRSSATL
jgi:arginyl-tRNA synthetase